MDKSPQEIMRMIHRVKTSPDGPDFMEYLVTLSRENYLAFKKSHPEANEFHKGYAFCIDNMISIFEECDNKLDDKEPIVQDWTS